MKHITIKFENAEPEDILSFLRRLDDLARETPGDITIIGPPEIMERLERLSSMR